MSLEREILTELEPLVADYLKKPTWENRRWDPSDYTRFLEGGEYEGRLREVREGAEGVSDTLWVVVSAFAVTEQGLPNYAMRGGLLADDVTGVSVSPWPSFYRAWNAEENQHGDALCAHLLLSGRVDMRAVNESSRQLIRRGFSQSSTMHQSLFYPMFQEPAATRGYANLAKLVRNQGDELLADLCAKIAGDERRHAQFYQAVGKKLFELSPEAAIVEFAGLMKRGIVMPSELMADELHEPPELYQRFANVAMAAGVYGHSDYADILEKLNGALAVEHLSVSGEAARAQEALARLPKRMRRIGERWESPGPVSFTWIHGRSA